MSPVIRAIQAQRNDRPGVSAAGIATPDLGAQENVVCWVEVTQAQGEKRGRPHSHDREEIILFVRGGAVVVLDGERTEVGAGDVVVIPPGTLHTFEAGPGGYECYTIEPRGIRFFDVDGNEYEQPEIMR